MTQNETLNRNRVHSAEAMSLTGGPISGPTAEIMDCMALHSPTASPRVVERLAPASLEISPITRL